MEDISEFRAIVDTSEQSPACKRARYDFDHMLDDSWSLSRNEVTLHSIYDSGVGRLNADSEIHENPQLGKSEQIAVLEASLSENTLQKLSLKEFDSMFIVKRKGGSSEDFRNHFDSLSDEVVLHIFRNLRKSELRTVALTCRRFRRLSEDESLWTKMDVAKRTLEMGAMGTILSRQVIILRLSGARIISPPILSNCQAFHSDFRSRLMYLDLSLSDTTPECLEIIFDKCKRLKKLSLESVAVNRKVLVALAANKDLEVLNLAMASGVDIDGLSYLLMGCRKLRELNLAWTYLSSECIKYVCENLPTCLDRFNFSGCRKLLYDESTASLVRSCPNLRELDLSDCTAITEDTIKTLTVLDMLNFLALSRCYLVPYRSILCLKKMRSLAYLDIHGSYLSENEHRVIKEGLGDAVNINKFIFSSVARPTVGQSRSTIWNMRVRD